MACDVRCDQYQVSRTHFSMTFGAKPMPISRACSLAAKGFVICGLIWYLSIADEQVPYRGSNF
jgi:hypothetical protein